MDQILTEAKVKALHDRSRAVLDRELFSGGDKSGNVQHLDATLILDPLAWSVLLPFVLSVASGLAVEALKGRLADRREDDDAEAEVSHFVGKGVKPMTPDIEGACLTTI